MQKQDGSKKDPINALVDRKKYATMTKEERLQDFKRTVAHPHLKEAHRALREAIREPGGASLILVYGPARVGKTMMKNRVIQDIVTELMPTLQEDRERVPVVSILPRPPLNSSFSWKDFLQSALLALEEPLIDHKILFENDNSEEDTPKGQVRKLHVRRLSEGSKDALRVSFETAVRRRRPQAVIIDKAQHLGKVSGGRQLQNQLDCIKSLADITETVHVLIGTYELLPLRNLSAQLIGRSLDIHFPRYHTTKEELKNFKSILSKKRLEEHAFSEAEVFEMMREAYEGERELAPKPEQGIQLRRMLGLYPSNMSKLETPPDLPQNPPDPQDSQNEGKKKTEEESRSVMNCTDEFVESSQKTRTRKSQPGRRNPKRDKTGQSVP